MFATVLIYLGVSLVILGVGFVLVNRTQTLFKPDYRMWLILGVVFVVLGFGTDRLGIFVLGLTLTGTALAKKSEWGEGAFLAGARRFNKRTTVLVVGVMAAVLVATRIVYAMAGA